MLPSTGDVPSAPRSRGANPRPPSPNASEASFASSTTSFRRMQRDKPSERKTTFVRESRFDKEGVSVDDARAFLSRPHSTWDSAFHELARLESLKQRFESDTCSNASSVSAYSFKSQMSSVSNVSRKGALGMLPKSPPPPPDLTVGGSGVGGYSFVAPRTVGSSTSTIASVKSQRVGGAAVVAGPAGGKSGIVRAMSTRGPQKTKPDPSATSANPNHPQSAPGGQRRQDGSPAGGLQLSGAPMFQVSGQFVPTIAPKRGK